MVTEGHKPFKFMQVRAGTSEKAFRRYEKVIKHLVDSYPTDVEINPSPLAVETYVSRLRDAIRAYGESAWVSEVDRSKVRKIFRAFREGGDWIISRTETQVTVGKPRKSNDFVGVVEQKSQRICIDGSDKEALNAAIYLLNKEIIRGPIEVAGLLELPEEFKQKYVNIETFVDNNRLLIL